MARLLLLLGTASLFVPPITNNASSVAHMADQSSLVDSAGSGISDGSSSRSHTVGNNSGTEDNNSGSRILARPDVDTDTTC